MPRGDAARGAKRVLGDIGRNRGQPRQGAPQRALADRRVLVAGPLLLLVRRQARTHTEPELHEVEQHRQFVVCQRICRVVAAHERCREVERRLLIEHRVRDRDSGLGDGVGVEQIAEVDQAGHARATGGRLIDRGRCSRWHRRE